jgi:hypothetical protein
MDWQRASTPKSSTFFCQRSCVRLNHSRERSCTPRVSIVLAWVIISALGSLAGEFLAAFARDAISLCDLIREAPRVLRDRVQPRPHGILCLVNLGVNVFSSNFSAAVCLLGCIVSDRHMDYPNIDKYNYA